MDELRVKARDRHPDDGWTTEGKKIVDQTQLDRVRHILEKEGSIVVQHWFYRGAQSPSSVAFDEYDDFIEYLQNKTNAGDAIDVWSMSELCKAENRVAEGKMPDLDGCVPRKGAY